MSDAVAAGEHCRLCRPRPDETPEWAFIGTLSVSSLYLSRNQTYRGHCMLVLDLRHATRPDLLTREEWRMFCDDLHVAETAIVAAVQPDHVNVASLGNVAPHLHWHIVPRYRDDPRWGAAIWTTDARDMPDVRLAEAAFDGLRTSIAKRLG